MTNDWEQENKVVMTKLPREDFVKLKRICEREDKKINKKIRELINQEINKTHGVAVEGKLRKFFIPSENRVVEMVEVGEDE
ncbi:MAG: hypothetical protein KKB79_02125 [Nanoarchaeota archaeon]|nr:hypothetical protein [Nanoarchaeota archaeon]